MASPGATAISLTKGRMEALYSVRSARPQVVAYVARKGRNGLRVVLRRALSRGVSQVSPPRWSSDWPYDMAQDWPASCILGVGSLTQEEQKTS